jgi:hypothetical protein
MNRDQFICEMMGKCWHEGMSGLDRPDGHNICKKCGEVFFGTDVKNPNYSASPADILALQQYVMGAEWLGDFERFAIHKWAEFVGRDSLWKEGDILRFIFSDPDRFATLVATFGVEVLKLEGWKP